MKIYVDISRLLTQALRACMFLWQLYLFKNADTRRGYDISTQTRMHFEMWSGDGIENIQHNHDGIHMSI